MPNQENPTPPATPLNPFEVLEQLWLAGATELELQVTPSQIIASFKINRKPTLEPATE